MEAHARDFGLDIQPYAVQEIYPDGELRVVVTVDGPEYAAGAGIVCSGGEPVKLGVPGEAELAGRGVSYCAVCDGPFFKGSAGGRGGRRRLRLPGGAVSHPVRALHPPDAPPGRVPRLRRASRSCSPTRR